MDFRFYRAGSWQAGPVLTRDAGNSTPGPLAFAPRGGVLAIARTLTDVQLVDPATGRALATLQAPEQRQVSWLGFSPDSDRLAVATVADHVQLWDLGLIRRQLAAMGLDWDEPRAVARDEAGAIGCPNDRLARCREFSRPSASTPVSRVDTAER